MTFRANAWSIGPFGCYATFDTMEIALAVQGEQPLVEGLEADYYTITAQSDGEYDVRVYYPMLEQYISKQDWARVS